MILVTGGAGYIGSHTVVELMQAGHDVFVIDNYANSKPSVLDRIERIVGRRPAFQVLDIRNKEALRALFIEHHFEAVMHFAGLKAVGESVTNPLNYYHNNVAGSITLLNVMTEFEVYHLVFSSSATVYGNPHTVPIDESFPLSANNPYGRSKLMVEEILRDLQNTNPRWHIALLRYFNPVGAHVSGLIGEDPNGTPNNLMPYLTQVAAKKLSALSIFGNDYPTPDGTGVRDYIHVIDLALGHVAAMHYLKSNAGILTINLGTGIGYSVLEMVNTFAKVSGQPVPYKLVARRPGDIAECYANTDLARDLIGWEAKRNITQMCADAWYWQQRTAMLNL
jgi:UDP-glucose 4-epimerase